MHTISRRAGLLDAGYFCGQVAAIRVRGFGILLLWQRRANERHALAQLDDRLLCDLGLSRSEAARESRKPFWRA
jgi:uncharacterized protein YjiS (DUF1127 family)